jgi:hypothetical protein
MTPWLHDVLRHQHDRGLVVDANVLLLRCVGLVRPAMISTFKRTKKYTIDDFRRVDEIWKRFQRIVTTPAILTEVTNLSGQMNEPARSELFRAITRAIGSLSEKYIASAVLCQRDAFAQFGLTDAGIEAEAEQGALVLTDDRALAGYIRSRQFLAIALDELGSPSQ